MAGLMREKSPGFTLMELILVILLVGILSLAGADLILAPFKGFKETEARTDLFEEGKAALERISKEVKAAVPNALYVPSSTELKLGLTDPDAMEAAGLWGRYVEDGSPWDDRITDAGGATPQVGALVSIYNRKWNGDFSSGGRIFEVTGTSGNVTILDSPVPRSGYLRRTRRYYLVQSEAVHYRLNGTTLERGTAPVTTAGVGTFGNYRPLARHVKALEIRFSPGNSRRTGVLTLDLTLSDQGEDVRLFEEVHVPNAP